MYLNPGTQLKAQNKDFGTVSQMDLPELSFVCGPGYRVVCKEWVDQMNRK